MIAEKNAFGNITNCASLPKVTSIPIMQNRIVCPPFFFFFKLSIISERMWFMLSLKGRIQSSASNIQFMRATLKMTLGCSILQKKKK